jgi:hypothetical protein
MIPIYGGVLAHQACSQPFPLHEDNILFLKTATRGDWDGAGIGSELQRLMTSSVLSANVI